MLSEAKAILTLLNRRGYEAFFIGGKCRNDLHNSVHSNMQVPVTDVDIVTNAKPEDVKKIFPNNITAGQAFQVIIVKFADQQFEVATYRKDTFDYDKIKTTSKLTKPKCINAGSLDEDRRRRDFTINAIAQDVSNRFIDFTYKTKQGELISSMQDVKDGIIRCIGDPEKRFLEDPLRILRMFRFQAQLGYRIDKTTAITALKMKSLLEKAPNERIAKDFNKLLLGKYAYHALKNMQNFKFFDILINGKPFMNCLKNVGEEDLKRLDKYVKHAENPNVVEAYAVLMFNMEDKEIYDNLMSFLPISKDDVENVLWLVNHQNMIYIDDNLDLRLEILNSKDGIVARTGRLGMHNLIKHMSNITSALRGKKKGRNVYDVFCERPYFPEQLRITTDDLCVMMNRSIDKENGENNKWINDVKLAILNRLVGIEGKWPYLYDDYMEYVKEGILDVFPDCEVKIPEEVIKMDGYGNMMDHHKSVQFVGELQNDVIYDHIPEDFMVKYLKSSRKNIEKYTAGMVMKTKKTDDFEELDEEQEDAEAQSELAAIESIDRLREEELETEDVDDYDES